MRVDRRRAQSLQRGAHRRLFGAEGVFTRAGDFRPVEVVPDTEVRERLFRHKVLRLLEDEGALGPEVVENLLSWKHPGFGAHAKPWRATSLFLP